MSVRHGRVLALAGDGTAGRSGGGGLGTAQRCQRGASRYSLRGRRCRRGHRAQRRECVGRRAQRQRADPVRSRGELSHRCRTGRGETRGERQAAHDLAQPQRSPGKQGLLPSVPQRLPERGQHLVHRTQGADRARAFARRGGPEEGRVGLDRAEAGETGRCRVEVAVRAARRRPGHRPDRGAHRPGRAGTGRWHADPGYRLPQPVAAGGRAHRLVQRLQPGGAVVPEDRRAGTARRARCHRAALERARVPFQQRVLRRLRPVRRAPHRAQRLHRRCGRQAAGPARDGERQEYVPLRAGRRARFRLGRGQGLQDAGRQLAGAGQPEGRRAGDLSRRIRGQREAGTAGYDRFADLLLEIAGCLSVRNGDGGGAAVQRVGGGRHGVPDVLHRRGLRQGRAGYAHAVRDRFRHHP